MNPFPGFTSSETFTPVPDSLFRLMNDIRDADELKVTLYVLWRIEHAEGRLRYISRGDILEDNGFMSQMSAAEVDSGLEKALRRGTLLTVESASGGLWMLNSPRGRAAAEALRNSPGGESARIPPPIPLPRPNIFKLYEENIGPLTPLMADTLKDAEQEFPAEWLAEAFSIAVERNKRNWKYIAAILRRWKKEGYEGKNRKDADPNAKRYSQSQFDEYLD
ncbi:MAG: DnaD domain protein [Anaerolineales bacterium]